MEGGNGTTGGYVSRGRRPSQIIAALERAISPGPGYTVTPFAAKNSTNRGSFACQSVIPIDEYISTNS